MSASFSQFVEQIVATSLLEWLAVVLALAYVYLAAKQNSFCWLCAFASTAIYTWLFWQVTLPFQSALNVYYMVMAGYGYYKWGDVATGPQRVSTWPLYRHVLFITGALALAWLLSRGLDSQFNSDHLWLDASVHILSVVTTLMVAHKILENWLYWLGINIASAYLCFESGLVLSGCLFISYLGFSIYGYRQWRQEWKEQDGTGINPQAVG